MKIAHSILLFISLSIATTSPIHALSLSTSSKVGLIGGALIGGSLEAYNYYQSIEKANQEIADTDNQEKLNKTKLFWQATKGAIKGSLIGWTSLFCTKQSWHMVNAAFTKYASPIIIEKNDFGVLKSNLPSVKKAVDEGRTHYTFDGKINISPYDILGVNKNASKDETFQAYQSLILEWHSDKNPNKEKKVANVIFRVIKEAHDAIKKVTKSSPNNAKPQNKKPKQEDRTGKKDKPCPLAAID